MRVPAEQTKQQTETIDEIFRLFAEKGDAAYYGEPVSQTEHALQAAALAVEADAAETLIAAALLHDIGHLVHGAAEDIADSGLDMQHEAAGEKWLASLFPPSVTVPIRLHVAAKRYLCAVDAAYAAQLSPASRQSLALQGGPFTPEEVRQFEANPYFEQAVRLRHWDDRAKATDCQVPGIEAYREILAKVLKGTANS